MTNYIQYGNQTIPMPDGMTLEQAKEQMARFFPELAEPKIDTNKKGDDTTYVFSKRAGTKGVIAATTGKHLQALRALQALRPQPILPTWAFHLCAGEAGGGHAVAHKPEQLTQLVDALDAEAREVGRAREALEQLAPAWPASASSAIDLL
jgi:hypothetical protein